MVRLVHNQNSGEAFLVTRNRIITQIEEKITLVLAGSRKAKVSSDILEEFHRAQQWIEHIGKRNVRLVKDLQQTTNQHGLARPDFAGQDDEALPAFHTIVERCKRFVVFLGGEQERRIWCDVEWVSLQAVKAFVHGTLSAQITDG